MVIFIFKKPTNKNQTSRKPVTNKKPTSQQRVLNFNQPKFNPLNPNFRIISDQNNLNKLCGFFRKQLKKYHPKIKVGEIFRKREAVKKILLIIIDIKQCFDQIKNNEAYIEQNKRFDLREVNETRAETYNEQIKIQKLEKELLNLMKDNNYNPVIVKSHLSNRPSLMLLKDYNKENL